MCGICGLVNSAAPSPDAAVRRMMQAMHHRGPDDAGLEPLPLGRDANGPAATFGFRRLSILDLSPNGHQPMVNRQTGDCLVFNGEIYNFRDLRARLQSRGVEFTSTGDTEVLLKALSTWGDAALELLDGMFAIAFYQASTRRVMLARDPLGIKPLYVSLSSRSLVFASEVRAILASGLVSDEYDPAGVASFLAYGAAQDPLTVHRDIKTFPCGTSQWFAIDSSAALRTETSRRYWKLPSVNRDQTPHEAATAIQTALTDSVRAQLVSDTPLAVMLSGGIDSGIVAALANGEPSRLDSFSVGFESSTMATEHHFARQTASYIGTRHREVLLDGNSATRLWQQWLDAADRPSVDGFNTFLVTRAVRDADCKVVLSGLGADELFGGYANFFRLRRLTPLLQPIGALPASLRKLGAACLLPVTPRRYRSRLQILADSDGRPTDTAIALRRILTQQQLADLGLQASECGLRPDFIAPELYARAAEGATDLFSAVSRAETFCYMGNTLLRDADTNSMANSIELRVPFLGKQVVEAAAGIPGRIHLKRGTPKAVLRSAFGSRLPPAVLTRPKTGFTLPVGDWLYRELRDYSEAAVDGLRNIPFVNFAAARRLWSSLEADRASTFWMKPALLVALGSYALNCQRRNSCLNRSPS